MKAVQAAFVEIKTPKFTKKVCLCIAKKKISCFLGILPKGQVSLLNICYIGSHETFFVNNIKMMSVFFKMASIYADYFEVILN